MYTILDTCGGSVTDSFIFGNISHRLVVKPRGACKGNSRGGHARLVGCARKAEKGNDAYVNIHELTKHGKTYLVGNRLLSSLLARAH